MARASKKQALYKEIKGLLRLGKVRRAGQILLHEDYRTLERGERVEFAWLARRAELPRLALKVLNPIVRSKPTRPVSATSKEKAEYAASLIKIGAVLEASKMLKQLDPSRLPVVSLYQAFACINQWDYENAIPLLEHYVSAPDIDPYQRIIGKLNLAAAFVHEKKHLQARTLLSELQEATQKKGLQRFYGNTLELCAQNAIFEKQWARARDFLDQASAILSNSSALDVLFVRKWQAVLCAMEKKGNIAGLLEIRKEAETRKHWETVRDCDYHTALSLQSQALVTTLFYGTPYEAYRRKLKTLFGKPLKISSDYLWAPIENPSKILDLKTGVVSSGGKHLKPGQVPHRLLCVLCTDFYRPFRLAALHSKVYPEEYFNPFSSPAKIHEAVKRLKVFFGKSRLSLSIIEAAGTYRLELRGGVGVRIARAIQQDGKLAQIERLRDQWGGALFSVQQAAETLGISARQASRLINAAEKMSLLTRVGKSSTTRYRLKI